MDVSLKSRHKNIYLIVGLLVIGVVIIAAGMSINGKFSQSDNSAFTSSASENDLPVISVSEQAQIIKIGDNKGLNGFHKIILDPYWLKEGNTQQVVVVPTSKAKSVSVEVKDENKQQRKIMRLGTYDGKEIYYIEWKPEEINSGKEYPINLTCITQKGVEQSFSLSWQTK